MQLDTAAQLGRGTRLAAAFLAVLLAATLVGCQPEPERDASGGIAEAGDLSVFRFRIGDCFDNPAVDEVSEVAAVQCSQPHDNEVFYLFDLQNPTWPGNTVIDNAFVDECLPTFEDYVGTAYEYSELYMYPISPTLESWAKGDREVVCVIYTDGSQMIGSVRGSRR